MDIFSHALWGGVTLGRKKRSNFFFAVAFSLLPDFFGEGVMFLLVILGLDNMPSLKHGHPDISEFPMYAQNFYNATHSLVIFFLIFTLVWLLRKKVFLPLAAWGIHILIDIPTHSFALFPTPFLWPLSNFKINGAHWNSPLILIPNFALLGILYSFWFYKQRLKNHLGK
ncbi:MAG: hypothetical protein E4H23_08860 [Chrysiogenales bacterium]|nr:MAG: hypothetical protein E4H23_08860 [Chrysiogenales bacterium]